MLTNPKYLSEILLNLLKRHLKIIDEFRTISPTKFNKVPNSECLMSVSRPALESQGWGSNGSQLLPAGLGALTDLGNSAEMQLFLCAWITWNRDMSPQSEEKRNPTEKANLFHVGAESYS